MRTQKAPHASNQWSMMLVRTKPQPQILNIIAFQPALRPALPCVYGPIEFHRQRALFQRMDEMINEAKLEEEFITLAVKEHGVDGKRVERFARYSGLAFRCNMAGMILGLDARGLSMRAADSPLLCGRRRDHRMNPPIQIPGEKQAQKLLRAPMGAARFQCRDK